MFLLDRGKYSQQFANTPCLCKTAFGNTPIVPVIYFCNMADTAFAQGGFDQSELSSYGIFASSLNPCTFKYAR